MQRQYTFPSLCLASEWVALGYLWLALSSQQTSYLPINLIPMIAIDTNESLTTAARNKRRH